MRRTSLMFGGFAALVLGVGVVPGVGAAAPAPPDDPNTLIVGGSKASEQYSWMASLQRAGEHSCGASLISKQWVVTAAHCVQGVGPGELGLRIGSANRAAGGTEAGVSDIVVHPDYAAKNPNGDIALLKLNRAVDQKPVRIADRSGDAGTPSRIIGWGVTCPVRGCGEPPMDLQQLETEVVPDSQCALSAIDNPTEICTGSQKLLSNACFGDSGGPQLEGQPGDWKLTGVTSRLGSPVPVCGTAPSVYTDATQYAGWISEHVNG